MSKIAKPEGPHINGEITARTCRLIGFDGSQLGLFGVSDAQRVADDQGLDLVEIAPNADPPVCKVMDYGKYKYEQTQKAKQARKKQVKVEVKEMKFRPKIDVGDYETKKGHVMRFLKRGARVKITIMFRGREMAHPEQGLNVLERLAKDLEPYAIVESQPKMEGRNMHMLVAPIKGAFDEKKVKQEESAAPANEEPKQAEKPAVASEEPKQEKKAATAEKKPAVAKKAAPASAAKKSTQAKKVAPAGEKKSAQGKKSAPAGEKKETKEN